jgi:hypothetical protein
MPTETKEKKLTKRVSMSMHYFHEVVIIGVVGKRLFDDARR